ncbi:MAG: hypothetical protein A2509_00220 [Candidatus Edwardsbacteria bacterium RIFOXYD12_FULL_50_11]|nr:MAG: hypothetical protein A2509_00220 [Candidatus Edwardsbacteria bacterium RIFOXYD12_FULL_50_11]
MSDTRRSNIVRSLLKYPLTADLLRVISQAWDTPYRSRSRARSDLAAMVQDGYLGRQPVATTRPGQREYLYFLQPKARLIVPEIEHVAKKTSVFRGFSESSPTHLLAVSQFCACLERSAGEARVPIVGVRRPHHFRVSIVASTRRGQERVSLIPDYTFVVPVGVHHEALFLELQNRTAAIMPVRDESGRSLRFKLAKYRAFAATFRQHFAVQELEAQLGVKLTGFRVLVVTTGDDNTLRALMRANQQRGFDHLFWFSTTAKTAVDNIFTAPIWSLNTRKNQILLRK